MDVHVPAAITRGLVLRGVDVMTAQLDGTTELNDPDLLDRATELSRVLFSQDEDLLAIGAAWQRESREFAGIVYAHQLALGIGDIVEQLELIAACAAEEETFSRIIHLPLS